MHNRSLAFDNCEIRIRCLKYHFLNSAAGIIHTNRVKRHTLSTDQDPNLPGGQKICAHISTERRMPDLKSSGHFSDGHIGPYQ